eukprot:gene8166-9039_t
MVHVCLLFCGIWFGFLMRGASATSQQQGSSVHGRSQHRKVKTNDSIMKLKEKLIRGLGEKRAGIQHSKVAHPNLKSSPSPLNMQATIPKQVRQSYEQALVRRKENQDKTSEREFTTFLAEHVPNKKINGGDFEFSIPKHFFSARQSITSASFCLPTNVMQNKQMASASISVKVKGVRIYHSKIAATKFEWKQGDKGWACFSALKHLNAISFMILLLHRRRSQDTVNIELHVAGSRTNKLAHEIPRLSIETLKVGAKVRRQRNADCQGGAKSNCCRQPLVINFRDIGLDHIIMEPRTFNAYVCSGTCGTHSMHTSDRVDIINRYNRKSRGNKKVNFHCSATKSSSLSVILKVGNSFKMTSIKGMIVDSCGCT